MRLAAEQGDSMGRHPVVRGRRLAAATIAVALVMSLSLATPAAALSSVTITGLGGGTGLAPANAGGTFVTIGSAPVITETAATTIGTGTFSLVPPTGFEFGGTAPTAAFTTAGGAGCALTISAPAISSGAIGFTIGGTTLGTTTCRLTFAGIQARPLSAGPFTGVVPGGVITMATSTASTITGVFMGMSSFGYLYETAPSLNVVSATGGSAISANTAVGGSATAWTALTGPSFSESAAGMLTGGNATGVFRFPPPPRFRVPARRRGVAAPHDAPGPHAL